jgi:tetratricopeptide (TPR) repeat protein
VHDDDKRFHEMTDSAPQPAIPLDYTNRPAETSWQPGLYWAGVIGLFALIIAAYLPAMRGGFIWDDDYYVSENLALRSFAGIQDIWAGIVRPNEYVVRVAPQYYPMALTSLWLDYRLWGLNTLGYHLTNVLLHGCSAWLLWLILRKLDVPGAWVVAAIWALHPLQVESVAWITERKNVLSGVFFFASLLVYLRFSELDPTPLRAAPKPGEEDQLSFGLPGERWKLYTLALVLFVCAVLSKSVTGTMPAVVLLLLWWKRGRIDPRNDLLPLLPFFAIAIAIGTLTAWLERNVVGAKGPEWQHSFTEHILLAGRIFWFYIIKLLVPVGLTFNYPRWDLPKMSPLIWVFPISALLVIAALWSQRRALGRGPLVAVLYYAGTLVPAMGFAAVFPMRYAYVADHFQYLAGIGIIALVVAAVTRLVRDKSVLAPIAGIVLAVLFFLTLKQAAIYKDLETLWTYTIRKNPSSWLAHANLASWYIKQSPRRYDRADAEAREALRINPQNPEPFITLGLIAEEQGRIDEAIPLFQQATRMHAARASETGVRGAPFAHALRSLGHAYATKGEIDKAILVYRNAVEINPNYQQALNDLGGLYNLRGRYDEAAKLLERAVEINPDDVRAHNNFGMALLGQGKLDEAANEWFIVSQRDPSNYVAVANIGLVFAHMGRFDEAIAMYEKSLQLKPDYQVARQNLEAAKRFKARAATQAATRAAATRAASRPAMTMPTSAPSP